MQEIDTEAKYFISLDMGSGYWKVIAKDEAQERLQFFNLYRKQRWKVMTMGALKTAPTFVEIMVDLQKEWDTLDNDIKL